MKIRKHPVRGRNEAGRTDGVQLPSPPRPVRLSAAGIALVAACAALLVGSLAGAIVLHARGVRAVKESLLFASESVPVSGRVVRVQRRGDGEDRRSIVHYEYTVGGQNYRNSVQIRGRERDRYTVGSPLLVRYLPDAPSTSWAEGRGPRPFPLWPAYIIPPAAILVAAVIFAAIRRQRKLLTYGRTAIALVTRIDKKRSDKGSYWRVEYKWRLLSGATRSASYDRSGKNPPEIGTPVPIVYDRDDPRRQHRYPLPLVRLQN